VNENGGGLAVVVEGDGSSKEDGDGEEVAVEVLSQPAAVCLEGVDQELRVSTGNNCGGLHDFFVREENTVSSGEGGETSWEMEESVRMMILKEFC